jgi:CDP-diacylglycerol---serine O-phosphatidyltransferase
MANKNSIFNFIRLPDLISLGNGTTGLLSIFASLNNDPESAALFILIAGVFDFFDGRVARRLNLASPFGVQLDSLCDVCSFVIAPSVFLYTTNSLPFELKFVFCVIYLLAGLLRLARFNITGTTDGGKYFEGMPVPFSILVVCLFFVFRYFNLPLWTWAVLYPVHALLMISTFRIRKF